MTTYHAILSETGDVYGSGETREAAIHHAIREVTTQSGIGPEPHQWASIEALVEALEVEADETEAEADTSAILDARTTACECCGKAGIHVDTTAGEIVERGAVVAVAPEGAVLLMVDERGRITCDDCADA